MNTIDALNRKFATNGCCNFRQLADGIVVAEIDNPLATATISLHGGHIVGWQPKHQISPVLWTSKRVLFSPGKAIRGGVPICWPWFGAHPANASFPAHGYARITPWEISSIDSLDNGATEIVMSLLDSELTCFQWPTRLVQLQLRVTIGDSLMVELTTTNQGGSEIVLTEGFHTYFQVSDVANIKVIGLDGCEYLDLTNNNARRWQQGDVKFEGELGRIYLNTKATCIIEDLPLNRRIRIEKLGSQSTAVWNPWAETTAKMADMESNGWRDMICVESANTVDNPVVIKPGASHTLASTYAAESIH